MSWFKRIKSILDKEPELWLAYLHGQKYDELAHLSEGKRKYRGRFTRFSIWIFLLLAQTKLRFKPLNKKSKFLVYAGTVNQKNSLQQTILALRRNNQTVVALAPKKILNRSELKSKVFTIKTYGFYEVIKSFFILTLRFNSLRKQLKNKSINLIKNDLNVFLNIYDELVYFERLLREVEPIYVIVSNDHNASNRALLALARESGIKTAYMQHASVSNLFPTINVDYAFLDGEFSLNVYRNCENNIVSDIVKIKERKVFLSGQKKYLGKIKRENKVKLGIAINALDSSENIADLISYLHSSGVPLKIRWHPGLSKRKIKELSFIFRKYKIEVSDPFKESLVNFFSDINCLISGNSSIHLEAALSDVVPIYYEITPSGISDYYGYAENGLAKRCFSLKDISETVRKVIDGLETLDLEAVRLYSSTYSTEWEGNEGELVAQTLIKLSDKKKPPLEPIDFD